MGMLADRYPEDSTRSHVMGIAMGGIAMGVLVGYPMGSVLYDFAGKPVPFLVISVLVVINGALQCGILRPTRKTEHLLVGTPTCTVLKDRYILAAAGSIWVSTMAMAVLEICLPIWLLENVQPEKWQLGMVFIPDSIGYLLGTNCFGFVALKVGRWLVAMSSLVVVGVSAIVIPFAKAVVHLIIPHFMLGLGIGAADSALMPFLAHIVDTRYVTGYGTVYAIAQAAVSLAYSLGPLLGGELVKFTGFQTLMWIVAAMNLAYSPVCLTLRNVLPTPEEKQSIALDLASSTSYKTECHGDLLAYRRFANDDSDIE